MLKKLLCFDPEFWNLLTLRTHCLELMSDKVMKAAVLSEMEEEEEKECNEESLPINCVNDSCTFGFNSCHCAQAAFVNQDLSEEQHTDGTGDSALPNNAPQKRRRRLRERTQFISDEDFEVPDDPEFKYNLKSASMGNKPMYSLRHNHTNTESSASVKHPLNRKREYLSRCVKSQILKRKGRKKRWLQGLPRLEPVQTVKEKKIKVGGKKRGRKPLSRFELSYPDNEIQLPEETCHVEEKTDSKHTEQNTPCVVDELENKNEQNENGLKNQDDPAKENEESTILVCASGSSKPAQEEAQRRAESRPCESPPSEAQAAVPAVEASPELDGPPLVLYDCPIELLHSYSLKSKRFDGEKPQHPETAASDEVNESAEEEPQPGVEIEAPKTKVSYCFFCPSNLHNTCL